MPSRQNGDVASFESHFVDDWRHDPGSRAQIGIHPAAIQFLIDNAARNDINPNGINTVYKTAAATAKVEGSAGVSDPSAS